MNVGQYDLYMKQDNLILVVPSGVCQSLAAGKQALLSI